MEGLSYPMDAYSPYPGLALPQQTSQFHQFGQFRHPRAVYQQQDFHQQQPVRQSRPQSRERSLSPRRSFSPQRLPITQNNVAIGSIVFLPYKEETGATNACITCVHAHCNKSIEDGAFNHPAVILNMSDDRLNGGELMAHCSLISGNPRPTREVSRNLPIAENSKATGRVSSSNFLPHEIMYLEKKGTMSKQCYIQTNHVFAIPFSMLRPFGQPWENRLSEESYNTLAITVNVTPTYYISTTDLEAGIQDPSIATPAFFTVSKKSSKSSLKDKKVKAALAKADEVVESLSAEQKKELKKQLLEFLNSA